MCKYVYEDLYNSGVHCFHLIECDASEKLYIHVKPKCSLDIWILWRLLVVPCMVLVLNIFHECQRKYMRCKNSKYMDFGLIHGIYIITSRW